MQPAPPVQIPEQHNLDYTVSTPAGAAAVAPETSSDMSAGLESPAHSTAVETSTASAAEITTAAATDVVDALDANVSNVPEEVAESGDSSVPKEEVAGDETHVTAVDSAGAQGDGDAGKGGEAAPETVEADGPEQEPQEQQQMPAASEEDSGAAQGHASPEASPEPEVKVETEVTPELNASANAAPAMSQDSTPEPAHISHDIVVQEAEVTPATVAPDAELPAEPPVVSASVERVKESSDRSRSASPVVHPQSERKESLPKSENGFMESTSDENGEFFDNSKCEQRLRLFRALVK